MKIQRLNLLAIVLGFGLFYLLLNSAVLIFAQEQAVQERIAFMSLRDLDFEIYVMNTDGTSPIRLTSSEGYDNNPAWSPDGKYIAFTSQRDGNSEIYIMNADGTGPTRLTNNEAVDRDPAWSPDGQYIAFVSDRDGDPKIYVMNRDGANPTPLTNEESGLSTWSPDSKRIAFVSGDSEIYIINVDGTGLTRLTDNEAFDSFPAWSPDGKRIAFVSNRDTDNNEIYIMTIDDKNLTRLTNTGVYNNYPTWSPDGKRLAFASCLGVPDCRVTFTVMEIYIIDVTGTNLTRLTNNEADDREPVWSPVAANISDGMIETKTDEVTTDNASNTSEVQAPSTIPHSGGILSLSSSKSVIMISTVMIVLLLFAGIQRKQKF